MFLLAPATIIPMIARLQSRLVEAQTQAPASARLPTDAAAESRIVCTSEPSARARQAREEMLCA